jgi:hypothetical protein
LSKFPNLTVADINVIMPSLLKTCHMISLTIDWLIEVALCGDHL